MFGSVQIKSRLIPLSGVLFVMLLLLLLIEVPVVLIGVVVALLVLVGVASINKEEDVLRLCFLVVVAGVINDLIVVTDSDAVGDGHKLDTDMGLRRCRFFVLVDSDCCLFGVL